MNEGDQHHKSVESIGRLQSKILNSTLFGRVDERSREFLWNLLEQRVTPSTGASLGYLHLRLLSHSALRHAFEAAEMPDGFRPGYARFATFAFRDGYRDLDQPMPNLKRITGRIDKLCRHFGLSGLFWPEIEIVEFEGEARPLLSYHHHGIVWRTDLGKISPAKLTEAMNERPASEGLLDKPVVISKKLKGQKPDDMLRGLGGYGSKVTSRVKQVWYDTFGTRHKRTTAKRISALQSTQLIHAWSLLELNDCYRGVGQGRHVRKAWKASLKQRSGTSRRNHAPLKPVQLAPLWDEFWRQGHLKKTVRSRTQPKPTQGAKLAAQAAVARRSATRNAMEQFLDRLRQGEKEL